MKPNIQLIAGPCSLESDQQIASYCEKFHPKYLRAGIYKLRTSKDSFQGLRHEGIEIIERMKKKYKFQFISEVSSIQMIHELDHIVDIFQVGTRNMYNYELLKELGKSRKTVLLKRGLSATIQEWIEAARYIHDDSSRVWLCERGIRSFENSYRNTFDINAIIYLKQKTSYKVIADPSHGTGISTMVTPLALSALIAGADGLLIESHPTPKESLSDPEQALSYEELDELKQQVNHLSKYLHKEFIF